MLLPFNSLPPTHTYIVNVIIQVLSVLAACVNLGEDVSHQLALGVRAPRLLAQVSGRRLEELGQRSLPITVLVYPSQAGQTVESSTAICALLPQVRMERDRSQRVMRLQLGVCGARHLQQVRQL